MRSFTFRRWSARYACSITILLFTTTIAVGQTAATNTRSDIQQARANAAIGTGRGSLVSRYAFGDAEAEQGTNLGFTLNGTLPIYYNSNAETVPNGGTQTVEVNPELRLAWKKQLLQIPITVSALLDVNSDRFAKSNGADVDTTYGKFRAQYVTGNDDQELEPFIEYGPQSEFQPTFQRGTLAQHDFTIGFDKTFNFDYAFRRIGYGSPIGLGPDTSSATVWSVGFTGTVTRRLTNAGDLTIAKAAPSITYNLTNLPNSNSADAQWNISLETDISREWYDPSGGFRRMDWLFVPILTVEFVPPSTWFRGSNKLEQENSRKLVGRPVIDLQFSFARVDSNQSANAYRQWQIGPMLKTAWKF